MRRSCLVLVLLLVMAWPASAQIINPGGGGAGGTVQIQDSAGNNLTSTGNALDINIKSGGGTGGTATADEAAFVFGTTQGTGANCVFQTTATNNALTSGQSGTVQCTANRAPFVNLRTSAGTEFGTSGAPLRVDPTGTTTQPVSGTVTANAGSGTFTVGGTVTANAGSGTFNIQANASVNTAQVNGVTTQTGTGAAGTGTQRVAVASDSSLASVGSITSALPAGSNTIGGVKIIDTAGTNVLNVNASGQALVNCANCSGSGASDTDGGTFTAGVNVFAPTGGVYNDAVATLTSGKEGTVRMTAARALHVNLRDSSGLERGAAASSPLFVATDLAPFLVAPGKSAALQSGLMMTGLVGQNVYTPGSAAPLSFDALGRARTFAALADGTATIGSLVANQSVNVAQVAGTATDTNSGAKSAGTQRVVLATDQPALTNALKVDGSAVIQPVSGTVTTTPPANASTNVTQFGGTNVSTGTGASGAGIPRVTVSNDSTVILGAGAATIGALTANQSVNVAQVNGVTTQTGTGTAGTGTQRVAVASDSSITANAGTNLNTSALALSATQTDRTQKTQLTDGTRDGTIKAASTASIATDTSYVVALSPNSPIPTGSNTIGALTANQSVNVAQINGVTPLMGNGVTGTGSPRVTIASDNTAFTVNAAQSGTWTVQPGNTANTTPWLVSISQGGNTAAVNASNQLSITCANCSGSGASDTDGGTFTAGSNVFAPSGGVFNDSVATLTSGKEGTVRLTANRAMHVNLRDSSGAERGASGTSPLFVTGSFGFVPPGSPTAFQPGELGFVAITQTPPVYKPGTVNAMTADVFGRLRFVGALTDPVTLSTDPSLQCPFTVPINQTSGTRLVIGGGRKLSHICSFSAVSATAQSISLVEGTGSVCATSTKGLYGGTTASAALAANGGVHGVSDRITIPMQVPGNDICLLQSASGNVSGLLTYGVFN